MRKTTISILLSCVALPVFSSTENIDDKTMISLLKEAKSIQLRHSKGKAQNKDNEKDENIDLIQDFLNSSYGRNARRADSGVNVGGGNEDREQILVLASNIEGKLTTYKNRAYEYSFNEGDYYSANLMLLDGILEIIKTASDNQTDIFSKIAYDIITISEALGIKDITTGRRNHIIHFDLLLKLYTTLQNTIDLYQSDESTITIIHSLYRELLKNANEALVLQHPVYQTEVMPKGSVKSYTMPIEFILNSALEILPLNDGNNCSHKSITAIQKNHEAIALFNLNGSGYEDNREAINKIHQSVKSIISDLKNTTCEHNTNKRSN